MKVILTLAVLVLMIAACTASSEREVQRAVEGQQAHYVTVQPIPYFDFSFERDVVIQLYKARNEARQTHSVITSQGTGDVIFTCPSIGDGIAADQQLTNPLAPYRGSNEGYSEGTVVEQPEPNGLFSSKNTDATYILCIMDNGDVVPVYTEQKVTSFPFEVEIAEDGTITPIGESETTIDIEAGTEGEPPASPEE